MAIKRIWGGDLSAINTADNTAANRVIASLPNNVESDGVITHVNVFSNASGIDCNFGIWHNSDGSFAGSAPLQGETGLKSSLTGWNLFELETPSMPLQSGWSLTAGGVAAADTVMTRTLNDYGTYVEDVAGLEFPSTPLWSYAGTLRVNIEAWGYGRPSISNIDTDDSITTSQTGITLTGTNLQDSAGNAVLELCNNATYASATTKVTQTWNSQTDTTLNFDAVQGALSTGTVYAFVTTALGQRNTTGHSLTLVAGSTDPSDLPTGGSFDYTGASLVGVSAVSDLPTGGSFTFSGGSLNGVSSVSDSPSGGSYDFVGADLSSVSNISDAPTGGVFIYAGGDIDWNYSTANSDRPTGGVYDFAGADIVGTSAISDSPNGGSFVFSGADLNSISNVADAPTGGEFEYTGADINGYASGANSDRPEGGVYTFTGGDLVSVSAVSDAPSGGVFAYSGSDIESAVSISDLPSGAVFVFSGGDIGGISNVSDLPSGGAFDYSGSDLDWYSGQNISDTPDGGVFTCSGGSIVGVSNVADAPTGGQFLYKGGDLDWRTGALVEPLGTIILNNINNPIILNNNMDAIILNNNGGS